MWLKTKSIMSTLLLLLLLSSSIGVFVHAEDFNPVVLEENKEEVVKDANKGEIKYYKFIWKSGESLDEDAKSSLSIMATPSDSKSDPDIYVSRTNEKPDEGNADYAEISYGFDMVVIQNQNFTDNTTFYIGVKCESEKCNYKIIAMKTQRVTLGINERAQIKFLQHASQSVTFKIPKNEFAERIIISAELFNAYSLNTPLHIYANKGDKEPSSSQKDLESTTAWFDGKAVVISKDNTHFCTDCSYTIVVEAEKGALITVEAKVYTNSSIKIELGESRNDAVSAYHKITYELDVTNVPNFHKETISIKLTPFSGVAVLYANRNEIAASAYEAEFKASSRGKEVLILTPSELSSKNITTTKLYITVMGYLTTTYKIFVSGFSGNYTTRLDMGVSENGYLGEKQLINFRLSPWGQSPAEITVSLNSHNGDPDLFFKSCGNETECTFTSDELKDYKIKTQSPTYPMFLYSDKFQREDSFTFTHDNEKCRNSNVSQMFGTCQYVIGVLNPGSNEAQFTLTASTLKDNLKLREGVPMRSYVEATQEEFYQFSVANDSKIKSVNFQVTPISGIVNVYASTTNTHPSISGYEKASYVNDLITFENKTNEAFSQFYYISVKGHTASTYSILATVNYDDTPNATNHELFAPIRLSEGEPIRTTMDADQVKFFKFDVDFSNNSNNTAEQSIRIILQPTVGRFIFYVNENGTLPTNKESQFQSFYHRLVLNTTNKNRTTYYVAVYPIADNFTSSTNLSFTLTYITSNSLVWLRAGQIFTDSVDKNRKLFFRFEVDPNVNGSSIKIIKSGDNGKVKLEGGINVNPLISPEILSTFSTQVGTEYFLISEKEIKENCSSTNNGNHFNRRCFLNLKASTTEEEGRILFSLLVEQSDAKKALQRTELHNGAILTLPIPEKTDTPLQVYYTPDSKTNKTEIVTTSPYHPISIVAKIYKSDEVNNNGTLPKEIKEVKPTSAVSIHNTNTIIISPEDLTECIINTHLNCVVVLTINRVNEAKKNDDNTTSTLGDTFSIIATSGIVPLSMGQPFVSAVEDKEYKYFSFEVPSESATLLISVTPLSAGDPDVFVSFGENERPTSDGYKFTSQTLAGEQLEISNEDILPKTSMEGIWVIGVFGYRKCSFQITIVIETQKIIYLYNSIPQDIHIKAGQYLYFKHLNFLKSFDINLMTDFGNGKVFANRYEPSQEILASLPTREISSYSSYHDNSRERVRIRDQESKDFGYFLIGVQAQKDLDFHGTILISSPGQAISMQGGKTFYYSVDENESQDFVFQNYGAYDNSVVDLSVVVYSGHIHLWVDHFPTPNSLDNTWSLDCNPYGRNSETGFSTFTMSLNENKFEAKYKDNKTKEINGVSVNASEGTYYIRVHGGIPSKFSIIATVRSASITLGDGTPGAGFTPPLETSNFQYYSQSESESRNDRIKVLLSVFETDLYPHNADNWLPKYKVTSSNLEKGVDEKITEQEVYRVSESHGKLKGLLRAQLTFSVARKEGLYSFAITNPHPFILNYTITIQDQRPMKLSINATQMSRIDVGSSDIFEIYVGKPGAMVVSVFPCFGRVDVAATDKLEEAEKNNFAYSLSRAESFLTGVLVVKEGPMYIRVRGLDGFIDDDRDPAKEALYKIKAVIFESQTDIPVEAFWLQNATLVSEETKQNYLNVSWQHVNFDEAKMAKLFEKYDMAIDYKFVIGDDPIMTESLALCDVEPHDGGQFKGRGKANIHVIDPVELRPNTYKYLNRTDKLFSIINEEKKYGKYATIVATVHGRNKTNTPIWDIPLKYHVEELRFVSVSTSRSSGVVTFFVVACLIGLVAVVVALIWYYRRFKTMEKLLNYEMHDIRNVAQVGDSYSSRRANQYTGLIGQSAETA